MKTKSYLLILISATLWGLIGFFVQGLYQVGFQAIEVVAVRVIVAALLLFVYVLYKDRSLLKINWKDSYYFVGTGIFSIVFFNWSYFTAMQEVSLSIAAVLLYTAPAFVTILSRMIFKERLTKRKISSLIITLVGIVFVIGLFEQSTTISLKGLIAGLNSGIGYALYSIFGKAALRKYDTLTITLYTFVFASISMIPATHLWSNAELFSSTKTWLYLLGLGLFPTVLAYILYTKGLESLESSRASIVSTIEPVVATLLGIFQYGERLTLLQSIGIALVILAVIIVQERSKDTPCQINATCHI
ncbi:DMT family transporter [Tepidibacillus fermentans]|uniref:Threonine/homoserine efflux transporter RhtA n=1 Tax=Tepidibacillus fermentans TaxID=1281767 RepID=A0A4R3KGM8_9BACI|nr:EamA family transporter [Tepidibacillus fermentans]TCS82497.1 threonine/homoserine efflux transporter RhtA [Tepidibacillus fermentans]